MIEILTGRRDSIPTFALTGVGGFVAPRHLKAIKAVGGNLLGTADVHDSVGVIDSYFPDASFFTNPEHFERFLVNSNMSSETANIDYLSICTPNHIHDTHIRMGLNAGMDVICEKPLVINPWILDSLAESEQITRQRICTVLQLREMTSIKELKQQIARADKSSRYDVDLTYITQRGRWYRSSWKGDEEKSGGLAMNIGIHFFDLLLWLFGPAQTQELYLAQPDKAAGFLELEQAHVRWYLSIDSADLPVDVINREQHAYRSLRVDGDDIDLSIGFTDLHTRVYESVLAGLCPGLEESRMSINLLHDIRHAKLCKPDSMTAHALLEFAG